MIKQTTTQDHKENLFWITKNTFIKFSSFEHLCKLSSSSILSTIVQESFQNVDSILILDLKLRQSF